MSKSTLRKNAKFDPVIGQRVRARRLMVGMSQGDLAEKLGLTFQQVQKYESGSNRVSASRLIEIAEILDVSVDYFFDGLSRKNERSSVGDMVGLLTTAQSLRLLRAFHQIEDAKLREHFVAIIEQVCVHS